MTHAAANAPALRSDSDSPALAPWGFALALATLGTAILWKATVGINWGIWVVCVVVALSTMMRERFGAVGAPSFVACAWAVVLAFGTAVTTDGFSNGLLMLATAALMAIALVTAGRTSLDALRPRVAITAPFVSLGLLLGGVATEGRATVRDARTPAAATVIRSAAITIPIITGLVFLLAEADPLFAAARDGLEHIVPDDFIAKSLFFGLMLVVTLGSFGAVLRGELRAAEAQPFRGVTLGTVESRVLLTALASTMWLFVGSAGVSLLRNPAAVAGSGITYAEYVHRGFAELSVSATIILGVVLATRRSWVFTDAWARRIAGAAIAGNGGMIAIAFMRVVRYEQAYGFTEARLHAQAYMIVLACMSALVLGEISRRAQSSRFAFHSANAALIVFASCVFFNSDAWIVERNVDRYEKTGLLDTFYLTVDLSKDATPALIASLPHLGASEQAAITKWFCESNVRDRDSHRAGAWFEWNYRASRAAESRRSWYRAAQSNCVAPP